MTDTRARRDAGRVVPEHLLVEPLQDDLERRHAAQELAQLTEDLAMAFIVVYDADVLYPDTALVRCMIFEHAGQLL